LVAIGQSLDGSNTATAANENVCDLDCPATLDRSNSEVSGRFATVEGTFAITVNGAAVTAQWADVPSFTA
jgi:hypothetical protein